MHRAARMATTSACSRMARRDPGSPSRWRVARYAFPSMYSCMYAQVLIEKQTEATAGMIPRAVEQVFRVADELKTKGWQYKMEGQFLEIVCVFVHCFPCCCLHSVDPYAHSTTRRSTTCLARASLTRRSTRSSTSLRLAGPRSPTSMLSHSRPRRKFVLSSSSLRDGARSRRHS